MACAGPKFWQLDSTVAKYFKITERIKFELRMEMFKCPNMFMPSDPDTGIGSGTMGQSTWVQEATTAARFSTPAASTFRPPG